MDQTSSMLVMMLLVLGAAMCFGALMERWNQSAVVGYMLAGMLLGPNGLTRLLDVNIDALAVKPIADLGVVLLMFTIGLEFNVSRLKRLGGSAVLAGILQIVLTMALIAVAVSFAPASLFGGDGGGFGAAGLAVGAAIALSSTAVVLPVLQKQSQVESVHGRFALGVLLIQDAAVVPLVLIVGALTGGAAGGAGEGAQIMDVIWGSVKGLTVAGMFACCWWAFVRFAMPSLLRWTKNNRELPILLAAVAVLAAAVIGEMIGLQAALAAFLAAIFLGESVASHQLRSDLGSIKVIFVTLFFASIGMLADPLWLWRHPELGWTMPIAVVVGSIVVLLCKPLVMWAVGTLMGLSPRHALASGFCMGQVGLFSFVLAGVALHDGVNGLISIHMFNLLVAITVVTLLLTPYMIRFAPVMGARAERYLRRIGIVKAVPAVREQQEKLAGGHVVVVGFGPAGRAVVSAAQASGLPVTVIDMNPVSVLEARGMGCQAIAGDASGQAILNQARIDMASQLVIAIPDPLLATAMIVEARRLAPRLTIVVRARYHRHVPLLAGAGADEVIDEEVQAGRRLANIVTRSDIESMPNTG